MGTAGDPRGRGRGAQPQALDSHEVPVDDSHVVADVSGSAVTLIGQVRTGAQRDAVVRAAWRGHAVMAVVDQIEITG
jgi:osmotically-inducible protein OsmY